VRDSGPRSLGYFLSNSGIRHGGFGAGGDTRALFW